MAAIAPGGVTVFFAPSAAATCDVRLCASVSFARAVAGRLSLVMLGSVFAEFALVLCKIQNAALAAASAQSKNVVILTVQRFIMSALSFRHEPNKLQKQSSARLYAD